MTIHDLIQKLLKIPNQQADTKRTDYIRQQWCATCAHRETCKLEDITTCILSVL